MSAPVPYRSVLLPAPSPSARHVDGDAGTAAARDLGPAAPSAGPVYVNPVLSVDGVDHGDPFVLEFCGEYVLYHSGPGGVHAYRSRDLVAWDPVGLVLAPQGPARTQTELRVLQVVREGGRFVMHVADRAEDARLRQHVARSASPTGPFVPDPEPLVGDPGPVCSPAERREGDGTGGWYRNDGGVVLERGGWFHHLSSGGVPGAPGSGIDVARAPVARGPWSEDVRNPVFVSGRRITGPGHPTVVVGPDGATPYAVYHGVDGDAHDGTARRTVCLDRLRWAGEGPRIGDGALLPGRPGEVAQPVPAGPVVDPDVPHRSVRAWVEGGSARVLGVDVALPARPALVTVGTDGAAAGVRLDGVVVARLDLADVPEAVAAQGLVVRGGAVLHAVTTSRLDDEHHRVLDAGTSWSWSWGGRRPVTAEVAVRGRATLRLGAVTRFVDTVELNGGTGFAVVVLAAADGAERLTVTADCDTEVADVVLASRPVAPVPAPRAGP